MGVQQPLQLHLADLTAFTHLQSVIWRYVHYRAKSPLVIAKFLWSPSGKVLISQVKQIPIVLWSRDFQ